MAAGETTVDTGGEFVFLPARGLREDRRETECAINGTAGPTPVGAIGGTMSSSTDSQTSLTLMDLLRRYPKDAGAWDRFVRRYRPKIYGWCRDRGLQEADAEDVAQD